MPCTCGHKAADHPYSPDDENCEHTDCFPCTKCNCVNYDMAPDEAGF